MNIAKAQEIWHYKTEQIKYVWTIFSKFPEV